MKIQPLQTLTHGEAEYSAYMQNTRPAKEMEYTGLKNELESIGYNLNIISRRNLGTYLKALKEARKR